MLKPTISQQVTKGISQQVESYATSPSLERLVSLEIIPTVTHDSDHVEDHGQAMDDVHESIAVGRTRRNPRKPSWLTTNMIVAYALPVVEEAILYTYREAEISSESKM